MNRKRKIRLPQIPKDWMDDARKLPRVEVDWADATTVLGWKSWGDLQKFTPVEVRTTGFLLPSHKDFLRVVPTIGQSGDMADTWLIPIAWVRRVKAL